MLNLSKQHPNNCLVYDKREFGKTMTTYYDVILKESITRLGNNNPFSCIILFYYVIMQNLHSNLYIHIFIYTL